MNEFLKNLDLQLGEVLSEVCRSNYWKTFIDKGQPNSLRINTMKWIMRDIWTYQQEVNRAVFTAIGRLGTLLEEQGLIRAMTAVQIEEVGHGTLAFEDFITLGGSLDESHELPSPPGLAVTAIVRYLGDNHNPLTHLGYMYFFEKFTVMITHIVAPILEESGYPNDRLSFMKLHAEEDERHSEMLSEIILECLTRYPKAEKYIQYGFDCFRETYPHSLWDYSLKRALRESA